MKCFRRNRVVRVLIRSFLGVYFDDGDVKDALQASSTQIWSCAIRNDLTFNTSQWLEF